MPAAGPFSIKRLISPVETTKERRRQELVIAAFNQIAEHGFEGLRTRDVADEVGVNIHGSPGDQLRNHLRAVRKLLVEEPELGSVMGELTLRSARDKSIASLMTELYDAWHAIMRGLLRRGVKEGNLRPELDSDGVAALVVATLTAMTLPTMTSGPRTGQAFRQLERWLGVSGPKATHASN